MNSQSAITLMCIVMALEFSAVAKDIYAAQSSQGSDTGADALNAHSLAWLNSAANWGIGTAKVSPGDVVHLCGTLTNRLVVTSGGLPGLPITLLFEAGAKFSRPAWGNPAPTPDNYSNDPIVYTGAPVSNLIIDGGANGLIEATDNGVGKSYTNNMTGIYLACASNVEVRHLTISNLYYRAQGATNDFAGATGVYMRGAMTNCSIHNCVAATMGNCLTMYVDSGISTNVQVYSNACTDCSWGIALGAIGANAICYDAKVWSNRLDHFENYMGNPGNHQDAIIAYITQNSQSNFNMQVYGNYIGPNVGLGNTTAAVFVNDTQGTNHFQNVQIFNNVLTATAPFSWANLFISVSATPFHVWNNTFISYGSGGCLLVEGGTGDFINNLGYGVSAGIVQPYGAVTNADYNVYWQTMTWTVQGSYSQRNFSAWRSLYGLDANSTQQQPRLNSTYVPVFTDAVANGKGTNLSLFFQVDGIGQSRPALGAWDIGALGHATKLAPASGLHVK